MENERIERFFSVFTKSVKDEILDFCRRISAAKADVYIFLARKAAVFCDCLEELGQIHLDGYVTTDRSLDIDGKWLCGKNVVIIDDAVVSGTTLYSTIKKVEKYGVENVSIQILTVNEKWYNPELLEDDTGKSYVYPIYNNLPDSLCIKLCNDIVQAISLVPRPYDVDFPLYRSINIPEYELNRILVLNNWCTHDVRTELQKDNNIINFSLIPNTCELRELSDAFGLDISKNCIVKIRVYGRLINKAKKTVSLRITPMIVFHEMESKTVEQIFNLIVSTSENRILFSNWSSTSQLRFLQFYYSNLLAMFWLYRIGHVVHQPLNLSYSYRNLSFLFPEEYILPIERICERFIKVPIGTQVQNSSTLRKRNPKSVYRTIDPISINARLYEPFLEMYHKKELPCRKLVLEKGKDVYKDPNYATFLNRLNEGMSFQDMTARLRDCINDYDIEQKVSEFIDRAVDAGIIVPIIQQSGTTIFRAYRHGEDVLFGHREELMYRKMLSLFALHSGTKNGITRIETEKMLVLFTKIGLKKKILYPYTSNFSSEPLDKNGRPMKILRVKPYLKGPVSLAGSALQHQKTRNIPFITDERKSLWLTYLLLQNGSLIQNKKSKKYDVGVLGKEAEEDIALLTEPEQTFVEDFAELTGRISNPQCDTGINFDDIDWARISVTLTLSDTVIAVAAEMEIFYNDFDIINLLSFSENEQIDIKEIKYFANSHAFESVHSAIMKIESFERKRGQALISAVRFPSSVEQRTWLGYFSEELGNHTDENNQFLSITFYEQKVWSYLAQGIVNALYILFISRYNEHYNAKQLVRNKKKAQLRMQEAITYMEQLRAGLSPNTANANNLFVVYDRVRPYFTQLDDLPIESSKILTAIQQAIVDTEKIASNIKEIVCAMLGERGKVNNILLFNYAIHINLDSCPNHMLSTAQSTIEKAYQQELSKIENDKQYIISKGKPVPDFRIDELPQKYKPLPQSESISTGIWYIAHGSKNDLAINSIDLRIASLAMNIFYGLYNANIDCRVTIFDRLSYESGIWRSTSEYAEYHCNQFNALIESFKEDVLFPSQKMGRSTLVHIHPTSLKSKSSKIAEKIQKSNYFTQNEKYVISGSTLSKTNYQVTEYNCTKDRMVVDMKTADFGILTILPEELSAIQEVFKLKKLPHKFGDRIYHNGKIYSCEDKSEREIVCTQAIGQGETSVVNAYHDMIQCFHPKIVFLVGIAGGILDNDPSKAKEKGGQPELDLCDVVIARSVVNYELRKEAADGVEHRGQCYNAEASVVAIVNELLTNIQKKSISATKGSKNSTINVLFEPIGSGNAVIANQLSSIVQWLKKFNSKVAAVEMEATGISSAFYESFNNNREVKGMLIVRGISDLANVDKDLCKKYRYPAAENAALVAKRLMEAFPPLD